jgi:hypothetical protein
MLLDPVNFSKYQHTDGRPFFCDVGGRYRRPPARLSIPEDGRWYVVVDLGGNAVSAPTVEVLAPNAEAAQADREPESLATSEGLA